MREALAQPDWDARFADWRAGMAAQQALRALRACGLAAAERADSRSQESCLLNAHHARFGDGTAERVAALKGCVSALVAERLHEAVGDAELIGWPRPGLNLVSEFSGLLAWEAHVALQQLPVRAVCGVSASRLAAHLLEARGAVRQRTEDGVVRWERS